MKSPPEADTRLTFGVELEFVLATLDPDCFNPNPKDPRKVSKEILCDVNAINNDIFERLKEVGIPATVDRDDSSEYLPDEACRTTWVLKSDVTVRGPFPDNEDGSNYYDNNGMEIVSPPYYYDEAAREAIQTVVRTLRKNYLIQVNESTGFHVHVGNGYSGLQWNLLRNLMAIAWTYERQILLILPEERLSSKWCRSLRYSVLGQRHLELTRVEFLNRILSFTENTKIVSELESHNIGRLGFNLQGLKTPFTNGKRTIEFRQHPGCLDPEAILHWVHICVKLVEKACLVKDDDILFERLRTDVERPVGFGENQVSPVDYLMWIDCPAQAYYYGKNMLTDKDGIEQRMEQEARYEAADLRISRDLLGSHHIDVPASDSDLGERYDSDEEDEW